MFAVGYVYKNNVSGGQKTQTLQKMIKSFYSKQK